MRQHLSPFLLFLGIVFFYGCADSENIFYDHRIEAAGFSIYVPAGWTFFQDQGYDTYIGRIAGPEDTIRFEEGFLSFSSLDNIKEDENTIYMEKMEIGGEPAIIQKTKLGPDSPARIRLSVFIEADYFKKNHLYVLDPSSPASEITIMNIFRSHQFK